MFEYNARLHDVVDGDTVDLNIDLGFSVWLNDKRIRLHHVDTPEKRTRDLLEKHFGYIATNFVKDKLENASKVTIKTEIDGANDKYGRILGIIFVDDEETSINDQLIEKRYAVEYNGQNKSLVAGEHINNYKYLVENKHVILQEDIKILYNQIVLGDINGSHSNHIRAR